MSQHVVISEPPTYAATTQLKSQQVSTCANTKATRNTQNQRTSAVEHPPTPAGGHPCPQPAGVCVQVWQREPAGRRTCSHTHGRKGGLYHHLDTGVASCTLGRPGSESRLGRLRLNHGVDRANRPPAAKGAPDHTGPMLVGRPQQLSATRWESSCVVQVDHIWGEGGRYRAFTARQIHGTGSAKGVRRMAMRLCS